MTHRKLRLALWTAAAVMTALAALSIVWALSPPAETIPRRSAGQGFDPTRLASDMAQPTIDAARLVRLSGQDLRRPLHDPPPVPPPAPPPAKPPPPLGIHLTGIIDEPGHSQALIAMPDGSVQLLSVGDSAGNAVIQQIGEGQITVKYLGHSLVLTVQAQSGG